MQDDTARSDSLQDMRKAQVERRILPGFLTQLTNYARLMRLDKPIGTWLLGWPALWALWLAGEGHPDGGIFIVFVLGIVVMRSAGCVLTDFADRKFDPHVERTRDRPIASGAVAPMEALTLFLALALIAIGLAAMLNRQAQLLAVVAAGLTVIYPFIKRYLSIPQFVLGMAFGWAVPMAFAAQTGQTEQLAWLVFGTALVWAIIYDTFYAMADREDDLKIGIKSTAILFGDADLFVIGGLQILMLVSLIFIGDMAELGAWYYTSVFIAGILMAYHQKLARDRQSANCFSAFLHNQYIGMVVFIGIVLHYTFNPVLPG
jgi:4-hydroxybenzoate polyprenyltransferase